MDKSKFQYKCSKCEQKFRFPCRLKEHEELVHSGKTYFCSKCSKEFKRKATRDLHEKSHEVDFSWEECDLCEAKFLTRDALGYHIQSVHNEGLESTHHCVFCERGFLCLRDFHRHIRYHIKEKPCFCKCGNEFNDQYALASHKETHHRLIPKVEDCALFVRELSQYYLRKLYTSHEHFHQLHHLSKN